MKLAIIGYGKMGRAIESAAPAYGDEVILVVDSTDELRANLDKLNLCDVAIEFSTPSTAADNVALCLNEQIPVVVGTTGWYDRLPQLRKKCETKSGSLFVASNFSIGMNIVFHLAQELTRITHEYASYVPAISETHHIHKLDAPSGTAIQLANIVAREQGLENGWKLVNEGDPQPAGAVPITSYRIGEVPGIHQLTLDSEQDRITLTHEAKGRQGLVHGVFAAAHYLVQNPGYKTMDDLLKF